jgi:aspartyl-tRNA synthetase
MVAGQDRYYQIVRCLRDEQPRADRSFEFTQLDVEMSFVDQEDVFAVIEPLYARVVRETQGVDVSTPFPRMTHEEMVGRFGTDKADLRYGMELVELGEIFADTGFRAFASVLADGGLVKGLSAPGGSELSRKELDDLVQVAKSRGAAGLVWIAIEDGGVRSPVEKHLSAEEIDGARKATGAGPGDLVLIVADRPDRTNVALDGLRRHLAERLGLVPEGEWRFCWLVDPPLFEWSDDEGKWASAHHPFTAPATDDLDPETARSRGYDLVLNGYEVGGGSIRIHRPDVQHRVFQVLGLSDEEIEEQFGHLLNAFRFGVPPHGGIAMGIDRLVMLMAGKETIRDVTAFPKAQSGADPLTGAPAPASGDQLRELGLAVTVEPEKPERGEEAVDG